MKHNKRRCSEVEFTKEMKKTHTVLIPSMLDFHFPLLIHAFRAGGYKTEVLENKDKEIITTGWEFSNNDICFPANLIIGQFITALKSKKYDLNKTALLLPQSGGGCRACNYIHLLRKALNKAGFMQIPVISLNVSGVEKHRGFNISPKMIRIALACVLYSDLLMYLYNKTSPYEKNKGESITLCRYWENQLSNIFLQNKGFSMTNMKRNFKEIAYSFSQIEIENLNLKKVCVAGEIYIKYCSLGNNNLENHLRSQNCEIVMGGFTQYMMYLIDSCNNHDKTYNKISFAGIGAVVLIKYIDYIQREINNALVKANFEPITTYLDLRKNCSWAGSLSQTMGDGWLVSAEIIDALQKGCNSCIIAVPFGCLVSHTCSRGQINAIKKRFPNAIISAIDYDSGSTPINQINRIKMILNFA